MAGRILLRILQDEAFSQRVLAAELERSRLDPRDRAFVTLLVYGTLTWLAVVDRALASHARKPLDRLNDEVLCHLRVAAYQLLLLRETNPAHAVVHETVGLLAAGEAHRVSGFANAILRKVAQGPPHTPVSVQAPATDARDLADRGSLPRWIADALVSVWGLEGATADVGAYNAPTPVYLRLRASGALDALNDSELNISPHPIVAGAVAVRGPSLARHPVLQRMDAVIQDAGSQAAVHLLPREATHVLDACAGSGTKTLQILDHCVSAKVVAADRHEAKLQAAERMLAQAGEQERFRICVADLLHDPPASDDPPYDAVLLDAPCSALGTLGRHPEVRWRRLEASVESLRDLQSGMLDAVAPRIAAGGVLVYVVCTFTPDEGPLQIERFLERHPDFMLDLTPESLQAFSPEARDGLRHGPGLAFRPAYHQTDGFWMTRLRRQPTPPHRPD